MRSVILQMQSSVDGFVGRKGVGPEWQLWDWGPEPNWDPVLLARFNDFFRTADTILLSRKMVEGGYVRHWVRMTEQFPNGGDFAFAHRIVEARKIVFSASDKSVEAPGIEMATKSLAQTVNDLRREAGGNIIAFGGVGFAASLLRERLVDEAQFYVNPVALDDGQKVFPERTQLGLIEAAAYPCGIAVQRYGLSPQPSYGGEMRGS